MPSRRISNWHYVYVLLSEKDDKFYIGYTKNLNKRFQEHNAKKIFNKIKITNETNLCGSLFK
jgi:predicted GIY-YIG superfamily endonuclease